MKKELTKIDYNKYIHVLSHIIKETEYRIKNLDKQKKIVKLSFEDWVSFQNNKLKI